MAIISIGTAALPVFTNGQVFTGVPAAGVVPSTTFLPVGVTGSLAVNYTTGSHSFLVNAGSALHMANVGTSGSSFVAGFNATGNSVWTVQVLGTIHALNTAQSNNDTPEDTSDDYSFFNGTGIALMNGAASTVSTVTVGAEGSVYGDGAGIGSATAMTVNNSGLIGGGTAGIVATADLDGISNLTLSANGTVRTITVTNTATGEIFGHSGGVVNASESNLVVSNSGRIAGGETNLFVGTDGEIDVEQSNFGNAVASSGRLTLTNLATGVIDGDVLSFWTGSAVTNAGTIYGTVTAQIEEDYLVNVTVNGVSSTKLDANRDLDGATDAPDYDITDIRLVGMTLTNSGTIEGNQNYLKINEAVPVGITYEEGVPLIYDGDDNLVHLDGQGQPYILLDTPVTTTVPVPPTAVYRDETGQLLAGTPAEWTYDANFDVYLDANDREITTNGGLPVVYATLNGVQYRVLFPNGPTIPFYELSSDRDYFDDLANTVFYAQNGTEVRFVLDPQTNAYVLQEEIIETRLVQVAFDGSLLRDVVTNAATGLIYGDVMTASGSDAFTNAGQLFGSLDMGDGNDTFTNAATGRVVVEGIRDQDTGEVEMPTAVSMGDGSDAVTAAGTVGGDVDLGAGNDSLTLTGVINGDLYADQIDFDGLGNEDDGVDRLSISATGRMNGFVYLGAGNNIFTNAGILDSEPLFLGDSTSDEDAPYALVVALGGADTLSNTATGTIYGGVDLGHGNNSITNAGRIYNAEDALAITTGSGNDTLTNSGTIGSQVAMFGLNRTTTTNIFDDLYYIEPVLSVSMGAGADLLTNTAAPASAGIFGVISMGEGADTVRGGASTEIIFDDAGADQYLLGAGADAFIIAGPDADIDTFDGSTGLDLISFNAPSDLTGGTGGDPAPALGHRIDLAAGVITYFVDDFNDTIAAEGTSNDIVLNVEQAVGSAGNDVIIGSAVADSLSGGEGDDTIRGGLGRDVLYGDEGADVFLFNLATDSGRTRATRDLIGDFSQVDGDQIWLNIDSNTRAGTSGNNATNDFVFLGNNTAFTGTGGGMGQESYAQIRTIWQAGQTIVEIDTNGDRVADFSFALSGNITVALADFYDSNVIGLA